MKGADSALSKTWIMAPTNDTMHGLHLLSHLQQPTPLLSHSHPLLAAPPVSSPNCGSELSSASGRDWGLLELNTLLPPVQPLFPATMHQTCCHQPLFAPALPCRLACLRAANSCRGFIYSDVQNEQGALSAQGRLQTRRHCEIGEWTVCKPHIQDSTPHSPPARTYLHSTFTLAQGPEPKPAAPMATCSKNSICSNPKERLSLLKHRKRQTRAEILKLRPAGNKDAEWTGTHLKNCKCLPTY